jgi:hypothetical protein
VLRLSRVRLSSALGLFLSGNALVAETTRPDARLTQLINEVSLLSGDAPINNAIRQQQQRGPANQNQPNRNAPQGPQNIAPPPPPGPR